MRAHSNPRIDDLELNQSEFNDLFLHRIEALMLDRVDALCIQISLEIPEIAKFHFIDFHYNPSFLCEFNRIRD